MAKVLVISSVLVVPPHSGSKARILGVARALRQIGHEVHFAFVATSAHEPREWNLHEIESGRGTAHLLLAEGPASKGWNRLGQSPIHFYRSALNRTGLPRRHYSLLD